MVNILGMDLSPAFEAIKSGTKDLFANLDTGGGTGQARDPFAGLGGTGHDPFAGLTYDQPAWQGLGQTAGPARNPFAGLGHQGDFLGYNPRFSAFDVATQKVEQAKAAKVAAQGGKAGGPATTGGTGGTGGGGPSTGLEPDVAKWGAQTQQTFGDLLDPDIMLAIMTNESHGDPNVQNHQGYPAYGLFQLWDQPGLNTDQQFQAARTLAQQKITSVNNSYAAHGMDPDARTRARDFALAWGGHFDYDTGLPNASSKDVGSGQTAQQLGDVFLANYDKIKAGRPQAPQAGAGGHVPVTAAGFAFPVVGYSQPVQLHWGSETGGSDIMAAEGTPIVSMGAGTIIDASPNSLGGNTVTMKLDNGLIVYMAHLRDAPLVRAGQRVAAGAPLGFVGTTGNAAGGPAHLHIGIGYDIINGSGPTGGLGSGFNAVDWLNQILQQTRQPTGGGGAQYR